jgi:hypothetical protein
VLYIKGIMDRHNHYEAAFAAFLRERRVCHIAIDETRRSFLGDAPAKSLDFIVHGQCGERFVVDVKGRRYPGGSKERPKHTWESWVTRDDVEDARYWAAKFGAGYRALFVFSYHLAAPTQLVHEPHLLWHWQQKDYLLRAIPVDDYVRVMKQRSPKWRTVHLPLADYRRLVRPLHDFLIELHWSRTGSNLALTS